MKHISGKTLGGSSAINFFIYHRPDKSDIDGIYISNKYWHNMLTCLEIQTAFEELGNQGWNWELLKKYYMKAEKFISPKAKTEVMRFDLNHRGREGNIRHTIL
jgi:choline dehydrogenase-like flavoprotein